MDIPTLILLVFITIISIILVVKIIEVRLKRLLEIFKIGIYFEFTSEIGLMCIIFGYLGYKLIKTLLTTNWINFLPKIFETNPLDPNLAIFMLFLFFLINVIIVGILKKNKI